MNNKKYKSMKMQRVIISSAVLAVAAVTILIIHGCKKGQSYTFETATVKKGSVTNTVTATGTLEAITSVVVGTQVSGIVEKLYVDFNSPVKKGQILAELDKVALNSQAEQAFATLESAKAETEYQQSNFERSSSLFEKKLVAQADHDLAKYNYEKSKATLKNAKANYDKAVVNLKYATIYSPIDGVVMNRAVDEGQTVAASFNTPEIFTIAQDLTQMQVEADIDETDIGTVKEGQRVEFDVDAFADEKFTGTVMQIRLSPVTTSNVVTYTVVINAPNPDQKLLPGMTANLVIYVEETNDVLTIPYKAVKFTPEAEYLSKISEGTASTANKPAGTPAAGNMPSGPAATGNAGGIPAGGSAQGMPSGQRPEGAAPVAGAKMPTMVWIKDDEGIHSAPVGLGTNDGDNAEVKSGLKEGDEVVTKMTLASTKNKEKEVSSNPFMPQRPGTRSNKNKTTTKS
jgi:HlyD family secretion protein